MCLNDFIYKCVKSTVNKKYWFRVNDQNSIKSLPVWGGSEARSMEISAKFLFTEIWIIAQNIYSDTVSVIIRNIFSASTGFSLSKNNGKLLQVTYKSKIHFPSCKGTTEVEMVGWYHWLDGHKFEQALGVGDGQGSLVCCSP